MREIQTKKKKLKLKEHIGLQIMNQSSIPNYKKQPIKYKLLCKY